MAATAPPGRCAPGRRGGGPDRPCGPASPLLVVSRPVPGRRVIERSGVKKILWPWGFWIFVTFYVVTAPSDAANFVHTAFGWLGDMADGFSSFVSDATA
jgi:hypothetical protein